MRRDNAQDYAKIPDDVRLAYAEAAHGLQEAPVVKRKVSFALVFALMIILLAGVAFAIVSWHQQAEQIARMEATQGYYDDWPAESRTALIQHMVDGGILSSDENVERLLSGGLDEAEASRLATEIITGWSNIREDAISLMSILEAVWGRYPYEWSVEDLAWYTQTLEATGKNVDTRRYVPTGDVLTKEQAIAIAVAYVKPLVNYPQEVWDGYTITGIYESQYHLDINVPYWHVEFLPPTRWTTRTYIPSVIVDPRTSEIYSDEYVPSPEQLLKERREEIERVDPADLFRLKTHEERAELTKDEYFGYSIPSPNSISEEEALAIAKKVFMEERDYTEEQLAKLTPYALYKEDVGGGRPVWLVNYYDETVMLPDSHCVLGVDMYADTGDVYVRFPWEY